MALQEPPTTTAPTTTAPPPTSARARILDTAYELFSRHGLRAVGIERIIEESEVAKKTFYRHFPSKVDLILAFLEMRGQRWTRDWLLAEIRQRAPTPREQLLAPFDVFDEWFRSEDYESCSIICVMFEVRDKADPVHQEAVRQIELVREILQEIAQQAGFGDPEHTAYQIQTLMMGAIVSATRGDLDAAKRARELAELLLQHPR